jgi:hypothetical protein
MVMKKREKEERIRKEKQLNRWKQILAHVVPAGVIFLVLPYTYMAKKKTGTRQVKSPEKKKERRLTITWQILLG